MTPAEAVDRVARATGLPPEGLAGATIEDFPGLVYVTARDAGGDPLVGGEAFVVDADDGAVHRVPASVPPRVNCRNVRAGRSAAATDVGPSGLEQPDVVDRIVEEGDGSISLVIKETRPWDGGAAQVDQLVAKVNSYVTFVADGQLVEHVPDAEGRPVRIVLYAFFVPAGEVVEALGTIRAALAEKGLGLEVRIVGGAGF